MVEVPEHIQRAILDLEDVLDEGEGIILIIANTKTSKHIFISGFDMQDTRNLMRRFLKTLRHD